MATKIKLTSSDEIHKFRSKMTCQLVGYVDAIESIKVNSKSVFKFVLNNGAGLRVQVYSWEEESPRTQKEVIMGHVIYLNSASCIPDSEYNTGNFHGAQIAIRPFTSIDNLGKFQKETHEASDIEPEIIQLIPLNALENSVLPWKFKICGYLKTKFTPVKVNDEINKAFFSITDGVYYLDATVNSYTADHGLEKGDKVELTGSMVYFRNDNCFLTVDSMDDIKIQEEPRKELIWLLNGITKIVLKNPFKRQKI
ncbi:GSCOCG00012875001-RA-CDS [Cotesia congregata]|uniref:Uncharacterized protein n=1 Tax=Cotesia congregata TaxID=51543 RepID=A0A8J2EHK9_COTCN|nr:GSCOCG00012875001-RA-CDS [Cotesia congregata]CAG5072755.1 Protein of unknown function [Cotesia congregata]